MSRPRAHDKIPGNVEYLIATFTSGVRSEEMRIAMKDALSRSWRAGYSCGHALKRYHAKRASKVAK